MKFEFGDSCWLVCVFLDLVHGLGLCSTVAMCVERSTTDELLLVRHSLGAGDVTSNGCG
jgi:hypothetical protein